jgi:hypothetical protein
MPGFVLTSGAIVTCGHGGEVAPDPAPVQTRVLVRGAPLLTSADTLTVTGCPGVSGVVCTVVAWTNTASRVRVTAGGLRVLVQALPAVPPGTPGGGTVAGPPPQIPLVQAVQTQVATT